MSQIDNGIILQHGKLDQHDNVIVHEDEVVLVEHCSTCGTTAVTDKPNKTRKVHKPTYLTRAAEEDYRR